MNDDFTASQIVAIIDALVGPIDWWGESNHDAEAHDNLCVYGEVAVALVQNLLNQYKSARFRYEGSVKSLAKSYDSFLNDIEGLVDEYKNCKEELK